MIRMIKMIKVIRMIKGSLALDRRRKVGSSLPSHQSKQVLGIRRQCSHLHLPLPLVHSPLQRWHSLHHHWSHSPTQSSGDIWEGVRLSNHCSLCVANSIALVQSFKHRLQLFLEHQSLFLRLSSGFLSWIRSVVQSLQCKLLLPRRERRKLEARLLPGMAQLCLKTVQVVRPFRGEVMIRVMPGRAGADKEKQASQQSPHHRRQLSLQQVCKPHRISWAAILVVCCSKQGARPEATPM